MKRRAQQSGAALMAMLAVIVLGSSWWLVSALSNPDTRAPLEINQNARALTQAKSALLGWVAHRALMSAENHPGRLPCPEAPAWQNNHDGTNYIVDDDGIAAGSCTLPAVGRLPWRTLGIDKLTDAAGEPLWYVVSPGWALAFPGNEPIINSNTAGQLVLDGGAAVALIIAPGKPLQVAAGGGCTARNQSRRRQPNVAWDLRDFLECENANSPADALFVTSGSANSFNDQVIALTPRDVWLHAEGPVAARIERDVVPQLQSVYADAEWNASAANPVFPFAATYGDPALSPFKGVLDEREGLLPLTASTCSPPMTNGRCDPNFVQWSTAGITVTKVGGNATLTGYNCAASSASQIRCTINYSRLCVLPLFAVCTATLSVNVRATAPNVGMALRTQTTAGIVNLSSPVMTATIQATGAARTDVQGTLPDESCNPILILGLFICNASGTNTVVIPITVFADHPLVNPPAGNAARWFTLNHWHDVTYYAVAPKHVPTGTRDCDPGNVAADATCLNLGIQAGAPLVSLTNRRAVLALAGRSVLGTAGSNRAIGDFLDVAENTDADTVYQQNKVSQAFNDRFIPLSP